MPANILNLPCYRVLDSFARVTPKLSPEPKPYIPKSTETDEREKNYGADISTLIAMIENGEL
jgi:transposase